jgi:N-acetylglucosaminyldiphosphoundecaprenol N-acetyl-beta-D-mannosaminyltransferase
LTNRLKILNIWVDALSRERAIDKVNCFLKHGKRPHSILASNPEKNFSFAKDPLLHEILRKADLLLPDGIGVVWAARILYGIRMKRLPGSDFFFDICELASKEGYSAFFYGAKEEINKAAVNWLKRQYPQLKIAGRSDGYVQDSEMSNLVNYINKSQAEILFLALGSPKQEKWFATYKPYLKRIKVCLCIGGTLDIIAGKVKRAPRIWRKIALEWLYRLAIEPRRIKRQKVLPIFVFLVLINKLKSFIH